MTFNQLTQAPLFPRFIVADSEGTSCTVAIAFIDSVAPGEPLPGLPRGRRYARSDSAKLLDIIDAAATPVISCMHFGGPQPVGAAKQMGWSQVGAWLSNSFLFIPREYTWMEMLGAGWSSSTMARLP